MFRFFCVVLALASLQLGCSSSDTDSVSSSAPEYGLTEKPYTSLQQVWVPNEPSPKVRSMMEEVLEPFPEYVEPQDDGSNSIRIGVVGRPNVGTRVFGAGRAAIQSRLHARFGRPADH